jgi:hypothetical protein
MYTERDDVVPSKHIILINVAGMFHKIVGKNGWQCRLCRLEWECDIVP